MDILDPKDKTGRQIPPAIRRMRNSHTVRWYILTLPYTHKGPVKGLQIELERRKRHGETEFDYLAPTYVEVKKKNGVFVETHRPLLYNYVFIHASESEIYRIQQILPIYNFLPRVKSGDDEYFPYLSETAMKNLQWVARSYANVLPIYTPESERLMKGDKVRITEGQFKGAEATVMNTPGVGSKDIMVCVENWMWVPLLRVQPGEYEVIELNRDSKHLYSRLDNERMSVGLHEMLQRHYSPEGITGEDRKMAQEVLLHYENLRLDSDVMRCKQYAFLLPAYTVLGEEEKCNNLIGTILSMLPAIKAEQSKALILTTLYGCTDSSIYYEQAHRLILPWQKEEKPKKAKLQLMKRLKDYDEWLGHTGY